MTTSRTCKSVTVRMAEELRQVIGLSVADTAKMEFRLRIDRGPGQDHSGSTTDPRRNRQARECHHSIQCELALPVAGFC